MAAKFKGASLTEAQFTAMVIALAKLKGWFVAHFRAARTSKGWRTPVQGDGKGFPDLILCRPRDGRILAAELKIGRNRPTPEQRAWLAALNAAGVTACVWRPEMWDAIEAELE